MSKHEAFPGQEAVKKRSLEEYNQNIAAGLGAAVNWVNRNNAKGWHDNGSLYAALCGNNNRDNMLAFNPDAGQEREGMVVAAQNKMNQPNFNLQNYTILKEEKSSPPKRKLVFFGNERVGVFVPDPHGNEIQMSINQKAVAFLRGVTQVPGVTEGSPRFVLVQRENDHYSCLFTDGSDNNNIYFFDSQRNSLPNGMIEQLGVEPIALTGLIGQGDAFSCGDFSLLPAMVMADLIAQKKVIKPYDSDFIDAIKTKLQELGDKTNMRKINTILGLNLTSEKTVFYSIEGNQQLQVKIVRVTNAQEVAEIKVDDVKKYLSEIVDFNPQNPNFLVIFEIYNKLEEFIECKNEVIKKHKEAQVKKDSKQDLTDEENASLNVKLEQKEIEKSEYNILDVLPDSFISFIQPQEKKQKQDLADLAIDFAKNKTKIENELRKKVPPRDGVIDDKKEQFNQVDLRASIQAKDDPNWENDIVISKDKIIVKFDTKKYGEMLLRQLSEILADRVRHGFYYSDFTLEIQDNRSPTPKNEQEKVDMNSFEFEPGLFKKFLQINGDKLKTIAITSSKLGAEGYKVKTNLHKDFCKAYIDGGVLPRGSYAREEDGKTVYVIPEKSLSPTSTVGDGSKAPIEKPRIQSRHIDIHEVKKPSSLGLYIAGGLSEALGIGAGGALGVMTLFFASALTGPIGWALAGAAIGFCLLGAGLIIGGKIKQHIADSSLIISDSSVMVVDDHENALGRTKGNLVQANKLAGSKQIQKE